MTYSIDTKDRVLKGEMIVGCVVRSLRGWHAATASGAPIGEPLDSRSAAFLAVVYNDQHPRSAR